MAIWIGFLIAQREMQISPSGIKMAMPHDLMVELVFLDRRLVMGQVALGIHQNLNG